MRDTAMLGGFSEPPAQSATAFRAAMEAMARPGRAYNISGAQAPSPVSPAAATLVLTLCDHDTPVFLGRDHDTSDVRDWITFHTGAPIVEAGFATFALGHWSDLCPLGRFRQGTPEYPDRSATLIVDGGFNGETATLTGPGIEGHETASVPGIAELQAVRAQFPLGLDLFLTDGNSVSAIPRSTQLEVV